MVPLNKSNCVPGGSIPEKRGRKEEKKKKKRSQKKEDESKERVKKIEREKKKRKNLGVVAISWPVGVKKAT